MDQMIAEDQRLLWALPADQRPRRLNAAGRGPGQTSEDGESEIAIRAVLLSNPVWPRPAVVNFLSANACLESSTRTAEQRCRCLVVGDVAGRKGSPLGEQVATSG